MAGHLDKYIPNCLNGGGLCVIPCQVMAMCILPKQGPNPTSGMIFFSRTYPWCPQLSFSVVVRMNSTTKTNVGFNDLKSIAL